MRRNGMPKVTIPERYNASLLLDHNLEANRGDEIAVHWGQEKITYREMFERACAAGRAFRSFGVEAGDRVLMMMDDLPWFPVVFLGAIRIGAVPVPVNPFFKPEEHRYFVEDSGAKIMVVDDARAEGMRTGLGTAAATVRILSVDSTVEGLESFDELVAENAGEIAPADTYKDDMAFWLYSSGSTGGPKGVVHLQKDILHTCETYARNVLRIDASDVTLSSTKLFHAYGLGNNLSFPYWAGASTVLLSGRPTVDALFDAIETFRPTLFFSVPTLYNAMVESPGVEERDLTSIRACVSAAEALPPEVWHRWKDTFGLTILDGIGSTEMLHIYCSNTMDDVMPGSSGKPVPGYELRLLNESGNEVGADEPGDLYVSGDSCFAHYWNKPEKTGSSLKEGLFFSGDRFRRDATGHYWYEGRTDDMFKVHGLWVSPVEVENALMEHPAVVEAAVVGVLVGGLAQGKAYVIPKDPKATGETQKRELASFLETRLHGYLRPRMIEFVDDFPRTATGKIQRFKLREVSSPLS